MQVCGTFFSDAEGAKLQPWVDTNEPFELWHNTVREPHREPHREPRRIAPCCRSFTCMASLPSPLAAIALSGCNQCFWPAACPNTDVAVPTPSCVPPFIFTAAPGRLL